MTGDRNLSAVLLFVATLLFGGGEYTRMQREHASQLARWETVVATYHEEIKELRAQDASKAAAELEAAAAAGLSAGDALPPAAPEGFAPIVTTAGATADDRAAGASSSVAVDAGREIGIAVTPAAIPALPLVELLIDGSHEAQRWYREAKPHLPRLREAAAVVVDSPGPDAPACPVIVVIEGEPFAPERPAEETIRYILNHLESL